MDANFCGLLRFYHFVGIRFCWYCFCTLKDYHNSFPWGSNFNWQNHKIHKNWAPVKSNASTVPKIADKNRGGGGGGGGG